MNETMLLWNIKLHLPFTASGTPRVQNLATDETGERQKNLGETQGKVPLYFKAKFREKPPQPALGVQFYLENPELPWVL